LRAGIPNKVEGSYRKGQSRKRQIGGGGEKGGMAKKDRAGARKKKIAKKQVPGEAGQKALEEAGTEHKVGVGEIGSRIRRSGGRLGNLRRIFQIRGRGRAPGKRKTKKTRLTGEGRSMAKSA